MFRRTRVRQAVAVSLLALAFAVLRQRERFAAEVRSTRAVITSTTNAVAAWRADHDKTCPRSLADLALEGYLSEVPRDAWGHLLRVTCPGRKDVRGFDVSSDGPDGEPGGLDRVE
jgi:general secretion pathway protein G